MSEAPAITMSSRFNDNEGYLALDGNPATCAMTGTEIGPWWKIDLNHSRIVTQVGFQGMYLCIHTRTHTHTRIQISPSLYRRSFHINPIKSTAPFLYLGNFCTSATTLNGRNRQW